jgi:hypothetical protein
MAERMTTHEAWLQEVLHQGAALAADMLAIWLASHPADLHEELMRKHIAAVRALLAELQTHKDAQAAQTFRGEFANGG